MCASRPNACPSRARETRSWAKYPGAPSCRGHPVRYPPSSIRTSNHDTPFFARRSPRQAYFAARVRCIDGRELSNTPEEVSPLFLAVVGFCSGCSANRLGLPLPHLLLKAHLSAVRLSLRSNLPCRKPRCWSCFASTQHQQNCTRCHMPHILCAPLILGDHPFPCVR